MAWRRSVSWRENGGRRQRSVWREEGGVLPHRLPPATLLCSLWVGGWLIAIVITAREPRLRCGGSSFLVNALILVRS